MKKKNVFWVITSVFLVACLEVCMSGGGVIGGVIGILINVLMGRKAKKAAPLYGTPAAVDRIYPFTTRTSLRSGDANSPVFTIS